MTYMRITSQESGMELVSSKGKALPGPYPVSSKRIKTREDL
jgi:hypothetical protein